MNLQLPLLISLGLAALYVFILMVRKLLPEKKHQYSGNVDELGRYDGVGKLVAINGDVYTGDFKAGTFHGSGVYIFKKGGGSYTGEFKDGLFHGQGKEVYPDGSKYTGGFEMSKRNGQGTMYYANAAVFTGQWKKGKKEGLGVFKYSDGTRFDGKFVDGKRDGVGFIFDKKNRKLQGKWSLGKLLNGGKLTRVLHKTSVDSNTGAIVHAHELNSDETDPELDQARRSQTPSKMRQRAAAARASPSPDLGLAGSGSGASSGSSSSAMTSPAVSHRKPLSAQKQKELTNNLLNFSKRNVNMISSLHSTNGNSSVPSSTMNTPATHQDRERSKLIAELQRAHSSNYQGNASNSSSPTNASAAAIAAARAIAAAANTTSSSSSSTQTQSPAHTPGRRADSALDDIQSSSGLESGIGESEGEKSLGAAGEWSADEPSHISNSNSLNPTPTIRMLSPSLQQRRTPATPSFDSKTAKQYASSGSEKENVPSEDENHNNHHSNNHKGNGKESSAQKRQNSMKKHAVAPIDEK